MAGRPERFALSELLRQRGLVSPEELKRAEEEQRRFGGDLGRALVDLGILSEGLLLRTVAEATHLPIANPAVDELPDELVSWVPVQVCERYGVIGVAADKDKRILRLATSDPLNQEELRKVAELTGWRVEPVVATSKSIERAIRIYYYGDKSRAQQAVAASPPAAVAGPPGRESAGPPPAEPSPRLGADVSRRLELLENLVRAQGRALAAQEATEAARSERVERLERALTELAGRERGDGGRTERLERALAELSQQLAATVEAVRAAARAGDLDELATRVARLEAQLLSKANAVRVLAEMLVEKGALDRDDYFMRTMDKGG